MGISVGKYARYRPAPASGGVRLPMRRERRRFGTSHQVVDDQVGCTRRQRSGERLRRGRRQPPRRRDSTLKKSAPFSFTPLSGSEKASHTLSGSTCSFPAKIFWVCAMYCSAAPIPSKNFGRASMDRGRRTGVLAPRSTDQGSERHEDRTIIKRSRHTRNRSVWRWPRCAGEPPAFSSSLPPCLCAPPASAQPPLSLPEAIARAKARNPDAGSAAAAEREAAERVTQVRGGYFPKVDVAESWQRGNHPVFVFSSLLAQRQFTAADFALDALNHPAATDNFRAAFSVEQLLFDRTIFGECPSRVDRAGHGGHRQATRRPGPDGGGDRRVWPRAHRCRDGSFGSGRGRDRPGGPRAGRQPPRRRPGDRRGCPAAGRLPGTHARTAGAGDVGRTHRARPAESVDGRAL